MVGDNAQPRALKTRRWRRGLFCLALLMALSPAAAQSPESLEYKVKAAFVYNFAKYVQWPNEPPDTLVIAVAGNDSLARVLEQDLTGKRIREKRLEVRRLENLSDATQCQILIVAAEEQERLPEILHHVRGAGVLTVGDGQDFVVNGGMIGFLQEENRLRFAVNVDAASSSGLHISSQVLKLATTVMGTP